MLEGRQRLRDWMERARLTQREAAKLLGIHYTFLSQILSETRDRTPALATALRIERVTGIPVEAWVPTDVDEDRMASAAAGAKRKSGKR